MTMRVGFDEFLCLALLTHFISAKRYSNSSMLSNQHQRKRNPSHHPSNEESDDTDTKTRCIHISASAARSFRDTSPVD
ncbi:unnamed protein product [Periconia digitata]|uniref:Secreted protein n=1 Tax=Periconia digitata TaxID=1303443 RepID=A0A9W4UJM5_9PLEO|nr:unnamed protein product [Periconia digitata]